MKALAYTYRPPFFAFLLQILRTGRNMLFENDTLEGMYETSPDGG